MRLLLKYIFLILVVLATGNGVFAQSVSNFRQGGAGDASNRARAGKKLVAARNRFLSQQLSLTADESRKFWPLYNQYQQELTAVRILKRLNRKNANGADQVNKDLEYDAQMLKIKTRYRDEFYKILPPEKVSELYKSESEFTDELIKQLSERSIRAGN